jgi:hypothetical protein
MTICMHGNSECWDGNCYDPPIEMSGEELAYAQGREIGRREAFETAAATCEDIGKAVSVEADRVDAQRGEVSRSVRFRSMARAHEMDGEAIRHLIATSCRPIKS